MKKRTKYILFIIIMYLFVFEFALMQVFPIFEYWDEIYALGCIIPIIMHFHGKLSLKDDMGIKTSVWCILFIVLGIISNIIFKYQSIIPVLIDLLLNLKFFMGIATTFFLLKKFDFAYYGKGIKTHAEFLVCILFALTVMNKIFLIFPKSNLRFGLYSEQLFFGHPTGLASVAFFLMLMISFFFKNETNDFIFMVLAGIMVLATLRFKAIASIIIFFYFYFVIIVKKRKIKVKHFLILVPAIALICWDEFYGYFLGDVRMETARGALLLTSFQIAKDFFPVGTGFGTFASAPSGTFYSPLYHLYHIDAVYGLSKDWPELVSDTFWAMLIGQNGVIGIAIYTLIILGIMKRISKAYKISKQIYLAGIGAVVYLLVSSTAESAFVNPLALPLSLIIGMVYCVINQCTV